MMRMKGHAIHDAAQYVPTKLLEYWRARRNPIAHFDENYLRNVKGWLTAEDDQKFLIEDVERELEADRDAAVASPMPDPETDKTHQGVYCDPVVSRDQAEIRPDRSQAARNQFKREKDLKRRRYI